MTVWENTRRGRIEGVIVRQDDTWAHICLTADSTAPSGRETNLAGQIITVRVAHLTEIHHPTTEQLLDFAAAHPGRHTSNTDMDIRNQLHITPSRYIQLLNTAIRTREAIRHDPATTNRLLREQTTAANARARRLHP